MDCFVTAAEKVFYTQGSLRSAVFLFAEPMPLFKLRLRAAQHKHLQRRAIGPRRFCSHLSPSSMTTSAFLHPRARNGAIVNGRAAWVKGSVRVALAEVGLARATPPRLASKAPSSTIMQRFRKLTHRPVVVETSHTIRCSAYLRRPLHASLVALLSHPVCLR